METHAGRTNFWHRCTRLLPALLGVLAVAGLLFVAQPAFAANAANSCDGTANDPDTCTGRGAGHTSVCLETLFGGDTVCTANDVRIGFADNVRDPVTNAAITQCISGSTLNFKADFHVELTAQARYDIGLYFATDGDPQNDGARTGACSVSKITATNNTGNFINLDAGVQTGDTCGDIDATHNPQVVTLTLSAQCEEGPLFFNPATGLCQVADPGNNAKHCVSLPNCTSWRQTGANGVCDSPLDAFPGTKSKCNCDDTFGIPVIVEEATLTVLKTAQPDTRPETGGTVTYTVQITNNASFVSVTINTIIDDLYGNLGTNTPSQTNNTCPTKIGTVLAPGGSTSCSFDAFVSGNTGQVIKDTVEVCGTDTGNHNVCGHDDATVTITDVQVDPELAKTALSSANCQLDVTYQVVVTNHSTVDSLTVNALNDNKFGDITTVHTAGGGFEAVVTACSLSQNPIPASGNANCTFVGRITSATCSFTHTDTVTGTTTDDDGVVRHPSDDASVTVTTTP